MKEKSPGPPGILLAVPAAVSLAAWALEEISVLAPSLLPVRPWVSFAGLALDSLALGLGLALAVLEAMDSRAFPRQGWLEILSSLPVIALASAPLAYAYLEGRPEAIPVLLLAARSLRILRIPRILPEARAGILVVLAGFELLRAAAGFLLSDMNLYAAAIRLLLLPEALLVLAAAYSAAVGYRSPRRAARRSGGELPVVGEDELAGLLGKRSSW